MKRDEQRWLRDLKLVEWGPRSLFSEYLEMGKHSSDSFRVDSNLISISNDSSFAIRFCDHIRCCLPTRTIFRSAEQYPGNAAGCEETIDVSSSSGVAKSP